jgi:hypothetical protein
MFSLAGRLPSEPSADDLPSLFRLFAGTSRPSDSLPTFMLDFWFMHLLQPARLLHCSGADRASRFSRAEFPCMPGSQTSQSPVDARGFAPTGIAFRLRELRRHSDFRTFRGSMAGLHVPLSTLHAQPCDCPRMTRGQVGSLLLTCATLTFATPRRFIPAHSPVVPQLLSGFSTSTDT